MENTIKAYTWYVNVAGYVNPGPYNRAEMPYEDLFKMMETYANYRETLIFENEKIKKLNNDIKIEEHNSSLIQGIETSIKILQESIPIIKNKIFKEK